jgi:NAD(P)-dependent dehydrogenase (short-subunit alcohol dehydrogenase family)
MISQSGDGQFHAARSPRLVRRAAGAALLLAIMMMAMMIASRSPVIQPQDGGAKAPPAAAARRSVLITGANRGLGLEFARQYHAAGWNVIATARDPEEAKDLKALGSDVHIEKLDVADSASVSSLAQRLKDQPIDLLINNAGISGMSGKLAEIKLQEFERVMQVNALGPVRVTQALLPNLQAGKGKMIVNITSGLGSIEQNRGGGFYGYRESKAALNMFTRSIAAELKDGGFICIVMSPGWVQTDMGGPGAQLTPGQSITGMRKVIDALKPEDSGKFWSYDGKTLPW